MEKKGRIIKILIAGAFFLTPFMAYAATGTIEASHGYAWGNDIGWVNFAASSSNVAVTDSGLSGYAWSQNYGWINLNPTNGGVKNNGEGTLSGYAWGENIGWINFGGVTINTSTGVFAGTATTTSLGDINFSCTNCSVITTWRPASASITSSAPSPVVSVPAGYGTSIALPPPSGPGSSSNPPTPPSTSGTSTSPSAPTSTITAASSGSISSSVGNASLQAELVKLENLLASLVAQAAHEGITLPQGAAGASSSQASFPSVSSSSVALPPSLASYAFTRNLTVGDKGSDVTALQKILITENTGPAAQALAKVGATGYFGPLTKRALAEFQKAHHINPPEGYFGPITRGYLKTQG